MKKYQYLDLILVNFIALAIGISLTIFTNANIEIVGAIIAIGISLSLGIRQTKPKTINCSKGYSQNSMKNMIPSLTIVSRR